MPKCELSGKSRLRGNKVSHSNIKTPKFSEVGGRKRRIWDPEKKGWVTMFVSNRALRTLSRKGWDAFKKESNS